MKVVDTVAFAEEHGLSVEEATLILSRRARAAQEPQGGRVAQARATLLAAQKRVGVHPVSVEGSDLKKEYDPDADVGKREFYGKGGSENTPQKTGRHVADDWEDPP